MEQNKNNNGKFRKKKIYFTQVSNVALRDSSLSLKAKGLYALIGSYITIEGFTLYKSTLERNCKEGKTAFENSWKELKDSGYLIQYKMRGKNGVFFYEYELLDEPQISEKSHSDHTPKNRGVDKSEGENPSNGKDGEYNNTNSTNTDFTNTNISTTQSQHLNACSDKIDSNSQVNLIENGTHLKLSNNQFKKVNEWDIDRLRKTIKIFIKRQGQYFALLEKIYKDDRNFAPKNSFNNDSNGANFTQRNYDYDKLERQLLGLDDEDDDEEEDFDIDIETKNNLSSILDNKDKNSEKPNLSIIEEMFEKHLKENNLEDIDGIYRYLAFDRFIKESGVKM